MYCKSIVPGFRITLSELLSKVYLAITLLINVFCKLVAYQCKKSIASLTNSFQFKSEKPKNFAVSMLLDMAVRVITLKKACQYICVLVILCQVLNTQIAFLKCAYQFKRLCSLYFLSHILEWKVMFYEHVSTIS